MVWLLFPHRHLIRKRLGFMRVALKIEYLGTDFSGSQFQLGVRTVQAELEKALSVFLRATTAVHLSGRTDAGVHARGQIAHFDCADPDLDLWRLCWALNGILADDISIVAAQVVPDRFHARFTAIERTYAYRILNRPQRSALLKPLYSHVSGPLDYELMQETAQVVVGLHDFTGFRSTNHDTTSALCRVTRAEILNLGEGKLEFWISANHFVYNMVRIIVGTLMEVGLGKRPKTDMGDALFEMERQKAGPTAPPRGLCLESVKYPEEFELFKSASSQGRELISNQEI